MGFLNADQMASPNFSSVFVNGGIEKDASCFACEFDYLRELRQIWHNRDWSSRGYRSARVIAEPVAVVPHGSSVVERRFAVAQSVEATFILAEWYTTCDTWVINVQYIHQSSQLYLGIKWGYKFHPQTVSPSAGELPFEKRANHFPSTRQFG